MEPLALIDGDILRYRIGFACEKTHILVFPEGDEDYGPLATFTNKTDFKKWCKDNESWLSETDISTAEVLVPEPIENCLHSVKLQLEAILDAVGTKRYRIFLTGHENFRDTLVSYYKANRDRNKRPFHYDNITEYLVSVWKAEIIEGEEADDALGYHQMEDYEDNHRYGDAKHRWDESTVICTIDKDLDMIPGWHYNFVKQEKYYVDYESGLDWFYCQLLTGDPSDNIPGLFKITGVKVNDWKPYFYQISEKGSNLEKWNYVVKVYRDALSPEGEPELPGTETSIKQKLRETGQLLWIRRKQFEFWEPPNE